MAKKADWIWRGIMLALVVGQYWATANFLPRTEWNREKEGLVQQLTHISESLINLDVTVRLIEANKSVIVDHESRLRALERRP